MLNNLPHDIIEHICTYLSDEDILKLYNSTKTFQTTYKIHISALNLKNHLHAHIIDDTEYFSFIIGFYSVFNLLKFLQHLFDTPVSGYIYDPFTSDTKRMKNANVLKDIRLMKILSRRNKTLDGLLDLFY